jgi:hypothetical protein
MIRTEYRGPVLAVAVQIFCARLTANAGKHGYSPDLELCVGEAVALVRRVDSHLSPQDRPVAMRVRRRRETIELDNGG